MPGVYHAPGVFSDSGGFVLTVFISGTDHGLGASLAEAWADRGALVFAGVLRPSSLPSPERRANGGLIRRLVLDLASDAQVEQAVASVREFSDQLDVVVNNGAILGDIARTAFEPLDFDEMARVYNINVLGTLRLTQAFLPLLLKGEEKLVVNISSEAGSIGTSTRKNWYAYAMSKAALNMQSALVHNLLREKGGRVLVLHPGHVRTLMQGAEDILAALTADEAARLVLANIDRSGRIDGERPLFLGPEGEVLPW